MRVPVALALAVPVLVASSAAAVYRFGRPAAGHTRTYYIAADQIAFAPQSSPATSHPASMRVTEAPPEHVGYLAAVYREYTDGSFTQVKPRAAQWRHLAFLGPLIRADVGDTVRVVFRNRLSFAANIHPDGVLTHAETVPAVLQANMLGAEPGDDAVAPGATRVYTWVIPQEAGPGPEDHGSVLWLYHSHTDTLHGIDAGLLGPMLVYKRGAMGDR